MLREKYKLFDQQQVSIARRTAFFGAGARLHAGVLTNLNGP